MPWNAEDYGKIRPLCKIIAMRLVNKERGEKEVIHVTLSKWISL